MVETTEGAQKNPLTQDEVQRLIAEIRNGEERPLTRDDVLKLIEANGGTADGLDLSGQDMRGIDLHDMGLGGIILWGARLYRANLQRAKLRNADLQKVDLENADLQEAYLQHVNLEGANLHNTDLRKAYLGYANLKMIELWHTQLQDADLAYAKLTGSNVRDAEIREAKLERVDWSEGYRLGDEEVNLGRGASAYRMLKQWYQSNGQYDLAGEFFYREMLCKGKAEWPKKPSGWLSMLYCISCGYGERPGNAIVSALVALLGLTAVFDVFDGVRPSSFLDALYFSAASFTAVGYGSWAPEPTTWARFVGVAETFIGWFLLALFLVTFTRKMTR